MGARKPEGFPIHILSLSAITIDHALQSRVATSVEYQREFSEAMMRGDEFPPITVFLDDKDYWLADGFHRYGARKTLARSDKRFAGIRAEVRPGTREEAIVFSAGANQKFSIPRTKDDIKKAVWMLLGFNEWRTKSPAILAAHVGTSLTTANKYAAQYYSEHSITPPIHREDQRGRMMPAKKMPDGLPAIVKDKGYFKAVVQRKKIYLGTTYDDAVTKLRQVVGERSSELARLDHDGVARFFDKSLILYKTIDFPVKRSRIGGYLAGDCIVTWDKLDADISSVQAIGIALCAREFVGPNRRCVVLCYREKGIPDVLDLGRQMGIEFLTPEEFVASLKGEGDDPAPVTPG